jgi:uncharacterized protein DUF3592
MEILFLLVGLVFIGVGIAAALSEAQGRRGACAVPGLVVGLSTGKSDGSGSDSYYPVAEYVGMDGRTRLVEASVGSSVPLNAVGDAVTVLIQPDDPERALIKSSLSYVVSAVLALMGLASCTVFFAIFQLDTFSIASAGVVMALVAFEVGRSRREKQPLSLRAWHEFKSKVLRPRVFTNLTKGDVPWADPASVETAIRNQRKANRIAIPILLLAGIGLLFLGVHLHRRTETFLQKAVRGRGRVVEMATISSSDSDTYAPVVEFEHEDRRYKFRDSISSNPPAYRTGQVVGVLYDPDRPRDDARIDRGRWNKAVPILICSFGVLLFTLGLWSVRRQAIQGAHLTVFRMGPPGAL